MNTTNHHNFSSCKAALINSIMCVLAMMVLVVSCPLKRMLQNKVFSTTPPVANSKHGGIIQTTGKNISKSADCFFATQKILSVKSELSRNRTLPSPLYMPAIYENAGIDIHYQSSLHLNDFNTASNHYAELPLFLQHLRLLI